MSSTTDSSAPPYPPTEDPDAHETPHGCYGGWVYLGRLVEHDGEEVEVIEAVPCRRCSDSR